MTEELAPLPPGYTLIDPVTSKPVVSAPDTGLAPLPPGYTLVDHGADTATQPSGGVEPDLGHFGSVFMGWSPPISNTEKVTANLMTGLRKAPGVAIGTPNSLGQFGDYLWNHRPGNAQDQAQTAYDIGDTDVKPTPVAPSPGWITRHTYSPDEITKGAYGAANWMADKLGLPAQQPPYKPETDLGRFAQDVVASAPMAALGPVAGAKGLMSLAGREVANAAGVGGSEVAAHYMPDSPAAQFGTGLLASVLAPKALGAAGGAGNYVRTLMGSENLAKKSAASNILGASGLTREELGQSITDGLSPGGTWAEFSDPYQENFRRTYPTTADVTQNTGLQNLTYMDQAAALRDKDLVYRNNKLLTNAAQREAVQNLTPDLTPAIENANQNMGLFTSNWPTGRTAFETGGTFRQGIQDVYDQRLAAQRAVGHGFDALDASQTKINLQPVMDYATTQAAAQAGEVGQAYTRALDQFKTALGHETLETAPFANSVLKGLGDLQQSYPPGSAAGVAVGKVKKMAEDLIETQEPAISTARKAYKDISDPLNVFDPEHTKGPVANAVATTRFGGYTTPNEMVVSQFLRSPASTTAFQNLTGVFPDVKAASQSLSDYIGSQVMAHAVNPNGTINVDRFGGVLKPYEPVLDKLPSIEPGWPNLKEHFATVQDTQNGLNRLIGKQKLIDEFTKNLSTAEQDGFGNAVYAANKYNDFMAKNKADITEIYNPKNTPSGAARVDTLNQIGNQLRDMQQTAMTKVPGQSGTPQALKNGTGNVMGVIFRDALGVAAGAEGLGNMVSNVVGSIGGGHVLAGAAGLGVAHLVNKRMAVFDQQVKAMTRQALTDPAFAQSLMTNYNPKLPSSAGKKAMEYVKNAMGAVAPQLDQGR